MFIKKHPPRRDFHECGRVGDSQREQRAHNPCATMAAALLASLLAFSGRRTFLQGCAAAVAAPLPARAASSLETPFEWTRAYGDAAADPLPKQTGLPASAVANILESDLANKYPLTGALTSTIFDDQCRFVDPNNAVDGLSRYKTALSLLFSPDESTLGDVRVRVTGERTIQATYVASGTLKLPWKPRIQPWAGSIVYTLSSEGLIVSQVDRWNITRFDAIRQTFTPGP